MEVKLTEEKLKEILGPLAAEAATKAAEDAVKKILEARGISDVDHKGFVPSGSMSGKTDDEIKKMESKERVATLVKALYLKDSATVAQFKALTTTSGAAGGFLVGEEFGTEVHRIQKKYGWVANYATRRVMTTDTRTEPRLGSSVIVYYPGVGGTKTESDITLEQVVLQVREAVGLTAMHNNLLADANVDIVDMLVELFAEALSVDLDRQAFRGTGYPFTGIMFEPDVNVLNLASGETTFAQGSVDDLISMRSLVSSAALSGAAYYMHPTVWENFRKEREGSNGGYLVVGTMSTNGNASNTDDRAPIEAGNIDGYPVRLSDEMPALSETAVSTGFVIFGNLRYVLWGDRQQMAVAVSDSATLTSSGNLFEKNMSAVRVEDRRAIAVALPKAFSILKTAAS